jgi:hypothetical protein
MSFDLRDIYFFAVFRICPFVHSAGYSQESTKAKEKGNNVLIKESKGKSKMAARKTYKMDKKPTNDK